LAARLRGATRGRPVLRLAGARTRSDVRARRDLRLANEFGARRGAGLRLRVRRAYLAAAPRSNDRPAGPTARRLTLPERRELSLVPRPLRFTPSIELVRARERQLRPSNSRAEPFRPCRCHLPCPAEPEAEVHDTAADRHHACDGSDRGAGRQTEAGSDREPTECRFGLQRQSLEAPHRRRTRDAHSRHPPLIEFRLGVRVKRPISQ